MRVAAMQQNKVQAAFEYEKSSLHIRFPHLPPPKTPPLKYRIIPSPTNPTGTRYVEKTGRFVPYEPLERS